MSDEDAFEIEQRRTVEAFLDGHSRRASHFPLLGSRIPFLQQLDRRPTKHADLNGLAGKVVRSIISILRETFVEVVVKRQTVLWRSSHPAWADAGA